MLLYNLYIINDNCYYIIHILISNMNTDVHYLKISISEFLNTNSNHMEMQRIQVYKPLSPTEKQFVKVGTYIL